MIERFGVGGGLTPRTAATIAGLLGVCLKSNAPAMLFALASREANGFRFQLSSMNLRTEVKSRVVC